MLLPLSLKIIIWILVVLAIAFILLKSRRKIIILAFFIVAGIGVWKGLKLYNEKLPDLGTTDAQISTSVKELIQAYETGDSVADARFLGKVVEVNGPVREIVKDEKGYYTVVLGDSSSMTSVRCSMDTSYNSHAAQLRQGSSTIVRGNCAGFNKDELGLGSDVILNRCAIIMKKE